MGVGIAHVFAVAGIPTTLVDVTPERSEAARARAVELLPEAEPSLRAAGSIEDAVRDPELVVEAVLDRPEVKFEVYEQIEAATDDAVIATNTSSIPIAKLASRLGRPGRFLGVHWFVPPLLVPCVEVIAAPATDSGVVERVVAVLERLGKTPVTVGDGPGFVANRIQFALFREAARIVEAGLATPAQVDEVVRSSFGFRLPFFGPFTIADLAGLDVYADIYATLERELGEDFHVPAAVEERVAQGDFGVKTGRGFLDISPEEGQRLVERRDRAYRALAELREELER
jgi:3-hydroxybutyryl-CoA dehydrogenase